MALSPNYGWSEPDNSSLVKNGAADIRTLGDAIDTSVWNVGFGQAGKNKVINGDFGIWQRGTTFASLANGAYSADRWLQATNKTTTISRQTFTAGTAPVAGYESAYFLRAAWSAGGSYAALDTRLEDVRLFAGQTITVSYWAKADVTISNQPSINQNFGSGGSTQVSTNGTAHNITTSWARYSSTISVPSISGKTIGTSSYFEIQPILIQTASASTVDVWGVQVEYGSKATPFQTATGTIQGELAACQRYYYAFAVGADKPIGVGFYNTATNAQCVFKLPVTMRTNPTLVATTGSGYYQLTAGGVDDTFNSLTIFNVSTESVQLYNNTETSGTIGYAGMMKTVNASASAAFSAEL